MFEQIAITLVRDPDGVVRRNMMLTLLLVAQVCDKCLATDHPEKCTHKLAEVCVSPQHERHDDRSCPTHADPVQMPRWLSSQKMEVVRSLLAEDPVRAAPWKEGSHVCEDWFPISLLLLLGCECQQQLHPYVSGLWSDLKTLSSFRQRASSELPDLSKRK